MEENKNICNSQVKNNGYYSVGGFLLEIVKIFVLAFIIVAPIKIFLFQPFFVQGASMEPNFESGEYLIVNELGYKKTKFGDDKVIVDNFKNLERGDVIVFRYPRNPNNFFIKRIIGLPGERVEIKNGKVFVFNSENPAGFQLDEEAYLPHNRETNGDVSTNVGDGEYFVLGDNRAASSDSRYWGLINENHVIGKVLVRAWPIGNFSVYAKEVDYK